ncbi:DUF1553 domain-containing protein [bacterium]|nr:DUF1553 domain-containing protein [bacterium]
MSMFTSLAGNSFRFRGRPIDRFAFRRFGLVAFSLLFFIRGSIAADDPASFFRNKVEPILRKNCYSCHSHVAGRAKGRLVLDWRSGWTRGGDRGPAIIPGDPDESVLIQAIRHEEPDLKMPAQKLAETDIATLVDWVRTGAFDDRTTEPLPRNPLDWWSLRPLKAPAVPESPNVSADSKSNPVDAFVRSKLQAAGLSPSPQANPRDLIRRLYFDLIGLPPTPEVVAKFEADPDPEAYARLVDELLNSPRYGERWARHWFDTIHFADSHGYEHDVGRDHAWPYRDYVIDAFNRDVPWATFVRQQIAVDVFEPEATHLIPALGFLGAGTFDYSTYATGPVTFDYLDRDDMLTQTMSAFVSTTANCARCHDHKFDPVTQDDYYALQAVFAGILKGDIPYDTETATGVKRRRLNASLAAAEKRDTAILASADVRQLVDDWLKHRGTGAAWVPFEMYSFISNEGATLTVRPDGMILAGGKVPETDTYVITAKSPLARLTAFRLDLAPDASLPTQGPGRAPNGNLHLSEVVLTAFEPGTKSGRVVPIARATADFDQEGWSVDRALDGDPKTAWGIHPAVGQPHHAVFELAAPLELPSGSSLTIQLKQLHGGSHLIGAFRLSATDAPPSQAIALPQVVQNALGKPAESRSADDNLSIAAHVTKLAAREELSRLPKPASVYAVGPSVTIPMGDGKPGLAAAIAAPKTVHVLARGEIDKPRQVVGPGSISIMKHAPGRFEIPPNAPESARRAALADWIAHRDNVLTWRSIVNRVWHYHFGRGLCDTPSDFGRMGGSPSHPELIDWLAVHFRDEMHGSLKSLHRLIVTSETYRQASADRPEAAAVDADNRLLWRQNRQRLDADTFRDSVLSISGRIDLAMGGPAIRNFTSSPGAQLTPKLDYTAYDWSSPGSNRRSIYRYVWRGIPDPLMAALDFPDLGLLSPVRGFSVSPLQSLALYNDNFVLHHARAMAERIAGATEHPDKQIDMAIRLGWQRDAALGERERFRAYLDRHGLPALCRVIMNSNEFLFIP